MHCVVLFYCKNHNKKLIVLLPQPHETIQNKDHSASITRTTDNDPQFHPKYTKLAETLDHNTSLSVTMSCTCPIVPFTDVQL